MKTQLLIFTLTFLLLSTSNAQITFQKTYGGSLDEWGGSVLQTTDGGYAVAGGSGGDFYLVKADAEGTLLWTKTYSGGDIDAFYLQQTTDGGYIITGSNYSGYNTFIVRADSAGDLLWSKQFSSSGDDWGFACVQANDGGFVFTGQASADVALIKLDSSGTLLWSHKFDESGGFEEGLDLKKTSDGGYCIAGYTGDEHAYLIKADSDGNLLWSKKYDFGGWDDAFSVQQCGDGGYILTGETGNLGNNSFDIYLLKTDGSGDVQWSKLYNNTGWNFSQTVSQTSDEGYLIIGNKNFATSNCDIWLIKTDTVGNIIWSKTYGGSSNEEAWRSTSGEQTSDGGYIVGGHSQSFSSSYDLYVIKTDANGNSGCNESDFTPAVTTPIVVATDPNTTVTTAGSLTTPSVTVGSGGVETTLCFQSLFSAAFSSSDTTLCEKFCINFFDQSSGSPVSWQWTFEGGSPSSSSDQNPINICYNDSGVFDVTLITADAGGNSDTLVLTDFMTVHSNPFAPVITQSGNVLTCSSAYSYQWYLNSVLIPGATNQSYALTQSGLYTVVIENGNGCQAQTDFDATLSGMEDLNADFFLNIFPNPASDQITISFKKTENEKLKIVNLLGQEVFSSEIQMNVEKKFSINIESLLPGIYKIIIFSNDEMREASFAKQ